LLLKFKQTFQLNIIELTVYILKKARYKYAVRQKKKAKWSQTCIKNRSALQYKTCMAYSATAGRNIKLVTEGKWMQAQGA
jgi:hypothetical protein